MNLENEWFKKVLALSEEAKDLEISAICRTGVFLGFAVSIAKTNGATKENLIELVNECWKENNGI